MHVQLVGVPASGKSTIVDALIQKYPKYYILGEKKYTSFFKFIFQRPVLLIKSIWYCLPILPISIKAVTNSEINKYNKVAAIIGLLLNFANYLHSVKNYSADNKIVIWDELVIQRALSIFAYSPDIPSKKNIKKYIEWCQEKCSALPVFICCNSKLQKERLFQRGLPKRMKEMNHHTIDKIISSQNITTLLIRESIFQPLIINSDNSTEISVKELHSKLISQL